MTKIDCSEIFFMSLRFAVRKGFLTTFVWTLYIIYGEKLPFYNCLEICAMCNLIQKNFIFKD